ncbi:DUF1772 domain-containing protein [Pseudomarimonas salicorniae]|uniref:DUF1772 domain-containing protein n=1 Tax=Pseudomarimonas salicorniae TaxID=2933270 RepID=A0ABT0GLF0_9GAMM|nr:DUF1772 domain-containing protein [Lysobacter sp. CAU 1642]MCK7595330.1 DUF1772 domain-containing protein [Lysobacter sp. CAU 1642]
MPLFETSLLVATLLCSLVAGFLLAFAVVVMPGIGTLGDAGFLRAFQVMDRVIQNNQPVFMMVWVGSVLALLAAAVLGFAQTGPLDRALLVGAACLYLGGVQLPTALINLPLNNTLKRLSISELQPAEAEAARQAFEARWNRSNVTRTVLATLTCLLLMTLLLRL